MMGKFRITAPDGGVYEINAPDGASEQEVMAYAQSQFGQSKQDRYAKAIEDERAFQNAALVNDMSGPQKFATAMGRGFMDVGQGIKQMALQAGEKVGLVDEGRAAEYTTDVTDDRKRFDILAKDSPITAGIGRIAGNVAGMPIPVGKAATLVGKMGQAALAGGAQGAVQFVDEGGSRLTNTAIGGTVGALIPPALLGGKVTVQKVTAAANSIRQAMPNLSQSGAEQLAAKILKESAQNPELLKRAANPQSFVQGTTQTLAEATDDAGIAGLQRTLANNHEFGNRLGMVAQNNNAARVKAIQEGFGGASEGAAQNIERARDVATTPLLEAAKKKSGVDLAPVLKLTDQIIKSREGNTTVSAVLKDVRGLLADDSVSNPNMFGQVQRLHNARQEIGNILGGLSPHKESGRAATRELMAIKKQLDAQISKSAPEFKEFLTQYAGMSKEAGRVRMGDELLGKSFATRDAMGNPILSPAQFARASDNLDGVAKQATGFKRETAERLMTPEQKAIAGNVRDDLDRYARSQTGGKAVGSNTFQNMMGGERIQNAVQGGDVGASMLPRMASIPMQLLNGLKAKQVANVRSAVENAMIDPSYANQILQRMTEPEQKAFIGIMQRLGNNKLTNGARALVPNTGAAAALYGQ